MHLTCGIWYEHENSVEAELVLAQFQMDERSSRAVQSLSENHEVTSI